MFKINFKIISSLSESSNQWTSSFTVPFHFMKVLTAEYLGGFPRIKDLISEADAVTWQIVTFGQPPKLLISKYWLVKLTNSAQAVSSNTKFKKIFSERNTKLMLSRTNNK